MPGWYIHMEAAKKTAERLRNGDIPGDFPGGAGRAADLGEAAHVWRNYLAAGAIGPDIFFLLPDFTGTKGNVLLTVVDWIRDVYEVIDEEFLEKWAKWAQPAIDGVGDVLDNLSGGVLGELGQALEELANSLINAFLDLLAQLWDWFGLLTSGVPQGFGETAFFWSDMLHYRSTYEFPRRLLERAEASGRAEHVAFALGWISHCATDVTGHAFVNEKCGGPYRLHWQRHHLIENHMDAHVYAAQHNGTEPYGQLDTSLLHFRLAFRNGLIHPYQGRSDAPAYDYFAGLPAYDTSDTPAGRVQRRHFFDLDSGPLPDDLCRLLIDTMQDVYGDAAPLILTDQDPQFSDAGSGRPSVRTLQNTYWALFSYVKYTSTGGYSPQKPVSPPVIRDHSPPTPPGSTGGVHEDPARGGEVDDSDFNFLDLLLAVFGWIAYIGELGIWLATLPAAVVADLLTYPSREVLHELAVEPLWNLYMASRRPLVMAGFLMPKQEEISRGLIQLGISATGSQQALAAALAAPDGTGPTAPLAFDEPTGRPPGQAYGADPAYPRAIIADRPSTMAGILGYLNPDLFCGQPLQPSEFLRPWMYPERNNAGRRNGWEPGRTHPGPYTLGQDARVVMNKAPGHPSARTDFESAGSPADTEAVSDSRLADGEHLGDPVDYGVYLIGKIAGGEEVPDFNLDADRGYGHRCWDWDRDADRTVRPSINGDEGLDEKYRYRQPCTVPEGFCNLPDDDTQYNPYVHLATHYLPGDPGCDDSRPVTDEEIDEAGVLPDGQER